MIIFMFSSVFLELNEILKLDIYFRLYLIVRLFHRAKIHAEFFKKGCVFERNTSLAAINNLSNRILLVFPEIHVHAKTICNVY